MYEVILIIEKYFPPMYSFFYKYYRKLYITPKVKDRIIEHLSIKNHMVPIVKECIEIMQTCECDIIYYEKDDILAGRIDNNNFPKIKFYKLQVNIPNNKFIEYENSKSQNQHKTKKQELEDLILESFKRYKNIFQKESERCNIRVEICSE